MNGRWPAFRLPLSFFISAMAHITVIVGIIYNPANTQVSIASTYGSTIALGLQAIQTSNVNTNQEAMAQKKSVIGAKSETPKKKKKKEKQEPKKQKKCKKCQSIEKKKEEEPPEPEESELGSVIEADNDFTTIGGAQSSGVPSLEQQEGGANLMGMILAAIKRHTTYPPRALERNLEGRVHVKFKLLNAKEFEYIEVVQSSGHAILDKHAKNIIIAARKSFPEGIEGFQITVPIVFHITRK